MCRWGEAFAWEMSEGDLEFGFRAFAVRLLLLLLLLLLMVMRIAQI